MFQISMKLRNTSDAKLICAFTLIELLLVLVLIAISVATITPRISESVYGWQVREISKNMLATIRLAHQLALTRQEIIVFALDSHRASFTIRKARYAAGASGISNEPLVPRQFLGNGAKITELEGFEEIDGENSLIFWPDGRTKAAHVVMTAAKDGDTSQWHIYVENDGSAILQKVLNK